ncbi:MAG: DEAD/DEAH box helicase, partial [Solirubrobacterales bacterium]
MSIAKVEPLTSARGLRGPFDYRLPGEMGDVSVGAVLRVPFGRRRVLGVVVGLAERSELPDSRLAEPIEALDPSAPAELVELGMWLAREYASTPARGIALALPPGTVGRGGRRERKELFITATAAAGEALRGTERLGARQRAALEQLLAAGVGTELSATQLSANADRATLRRLAQRGLVTTREAARSARPVTIPVGEPAREVELNPPQREAVMALGQALEGGSQRRELLLHGVTGSGKTEVYLAGAERALDMGRGVIALVPEIGLAPQTVTRFRARFGDRVAVLHSSLSERERRSEWMRLRTGEARVCVGPRSAAFAPVADLGLVIVDEEHDPSYKQESDPRYDARVVARERARRAGAALILGTATPRPESWVGLERLELPERVDGSALPPVEILDMRGRHGSAGAFH